MTRMKVLQLGQFNGPLPAKSSPHQTGWVVTSHYEKGTTATEADLFKLLGEALDHHEQLGRAIENLRQLLGVTKR